MAFSLVWSISMRRPWLLPVESYCNLTLSQLGLVTLASTDFKSVRTDSFERGSGPVMSKDTFIVKQLLVFVIAVVVILLVVSVVVVGLVVVMVVVVTTVDEGVAGVVVTIVVVGVVAATVVFLLQIEPDEF